MKKCQTDLAFATCSSTQPFHIIDVSEEWTQQFGYSREQMKARSLKILQGPLSDAKKFSDLMKALSLGQNHTSVLSVYKKDGSVSLVRFRASHTSKENGNCSIVTAKEENCSVSLQHDDSASQDQLPESFELCLNHDYSRNTARRGTAPSISLCNTASSPEELSRAVLHPSSKTAESAAEQPNLRESLRIDLSRASCQICKALIVADKAREQLHLGYMGDAARKQQLQCACSKIALTTLLRLCSGRDGAELALCEAILRAEELPQVGRWHRRDLAPAAIAAWQAALDAFARARERSSSGGSGSGRSGSSGSSMPVSRG
jgi:PAS domain S-box-containing protein